jgi:hypothetical protein
MSLAVCMCYPVDRLHLAVCLTSVENTRHEFCCLHLLSCRPFASGCLPYFGGEYEA